MLFVIIHSEASKLFVESNNGEVIITNNGIDPKIIKEGNGIKNMKFIAKENDFEISFLLNPYRIVIKDNKDKN